MNPNMTRPLFFAGGSRGCLMIHGFTSSPFDLRPLSKHLHSCGFTVQEVLLPGHGTGFQDMAKYGWSDWLRAVEDGLAKLLNRCSSVWLLGFSMGGILAVLAASRNPVAGLVSISAPIWPQANRAKYAFIFKHFVKYTDLGKGPGQKIPSWRYQQVTLKSIDDLMQLIKLGKGALPKVYVPTLVVQGLDDQTVKPKSASFIYTKLGAETKELFFLPGDHLLLLESTHEKVCKRVSAFIFQIGGNSDGCR